MVNGRASGGQDCCALGLCPIHAISFVGTTLPRSILPEDTLQESNRSLRFLCNVNNCDSSPTRQSLLIRLKDWGDQESWREFFELYWRLLHATALKAGLTEVEAQEVVQEVMIAVAKKMPGFTYEPGKDSLKGWLLSVTRWKVADQFRKRRTPGGFPDAPRLAPSPPPEEDSARTATVERVPDPNAFSLEAIWDGEWRENLLRAALDGVKRRVNPAHYEIYHLHAIQSLSPRETARALGVSTAAVHLANYRVGRLVKAEVRRLTKASPP